MSAKTRHANKQAYKLIGLSLAAVVLGCLLPLVSVHSHDNIGRAYLIVMEIIGAGTLSYVFGAFLLKK